MTKSSAVQHSDRHFDIAVIGGGVAGTYAAWRLKQDRERYPKIALFEYSDRIGGRLLTRHLKGIRHVNAELGGMRYEPEVHQLVQGLVQQFELPTYPFLMGYQRDEHDTIGDGSNNFAYFRGRHLRIADLKSDRNPYNLSPTEQGKTPEELQKQIIEVLVSQQQLSLEQWFDVEIYGKKLYKYGFWNLMARVLSAEAYAYLRDVGGYDTLVSNRNAVSALPIEFKGETQYRAFRNGYQQLPQTLADRFTDIGGRLLKNHRLARIERQADQTYQLNFVLTQTQNYRTADCSPQEFVSFSANQVILAMPRRSLELIKWTPIPHMKSVLKQPALKVFLGYSHPWWRGLDLHAGRSIPTGRFPAALRRKMPG